MDSFGLQRIRKRKPKRCSVCHCMIEAGQYAERWCWADGGDFGVEEAHPGCADLIAAYLYEYNVDSFDYETFCYALEAYATSLETLMETVRDPEEAHRLMALWQGMREANDNGDD